MKHDSHPLYLNGNALRECIEKLIAAEVELTRQGWTDLRFRAEEYYGSIEICIDGKRPTTETEREEESRRTEEADAQMRQLYEKLKIKYEVPIL